MRNSAQMKSLGLAVRRLRLARGWTLERLALEMNNGYDGANLSRFERGRQSISSTNLERLCRALGVSISELAQAGELPVTPPSPRRESAQNDTGIANNLHLAQIVEIPVLSSEALGAAPPDGGHPAPAETLRVAGPADFAWRVPDDSMTEPAHPLSCPCGTVVVFRQIAHRPGHCVLVALPGNRVTFAQFTLAAGAPYLAPLNPRYPAQPLPEGARILGVAVSASKSLLTD